MVSLTCVKFPCRLWCLLNFPDVSLLSVHDHDVNSQIKQKQKYMPLTKVDISSRNKVDIENHYPCFSVLQLKRSCDKRMFIFTINFFFLFLFLVCVKWACIKRQWIWFVIARIPHSTVLIYFRQREKAILWPSW